MDFTSDERKHKLVEFEQFIEKKYEKIDPETPISELFTLKKISSGVEGVVYKAKNKDSNKKKVDTIVIKRVDLVAIKYSKAINRFTLNATPDALYTLFESKKVFNNTALIELIASTLVNQLIFQKISPHYSLNYYWDLEIPKSTVDKNIKDRYLNTYNEYVNGGDFEDWAEEHNEPELWFNALFQIMVGLCAMKRYYGLLHTDFHTKNILIQKVTPGGYWEYTIDGNQYYVPNLGYVFLIHDFGFAWIPRKMKVDWYYRKHLRYVNKNGENFYDLNTFFDIVLYDRDFLTPKEFKKVIKSVFEREEWEYIYAKDHYRQEEIEDDMNRYEYKKIMREYPEINKKYTGLDTTIADKIYQLFHESHGKKNKYFHYSDKQHQTKNQTLIESYSLDKPLDKEKLPDNFKKLLVKSSTKTTKTKRSK